MKLDLVKAAYKACRRRYNYQYSWGSYKLLLAVTLLYAQMAKGVK